MGSSFRADETILSWTSPSSISICIEMMAIRFTLEKAITFIHHSFVMMSTDNTTVFSYMNRQGGTHSPNLHVCIEVCKNLNWCHEHDIVVRVRHISGKFNILTDSLSRLDKPIKTECALDQTIANSIFQMLNYPNVDLFATQFNRKLPLYVSRVPDSHVLAVGALLMNWNLLHAYAFPPTNLISSILVKIIQSQCRIVLIAPFWPQRPWFSELLQLLVSAPIRLPLFPRLLTQSKGKFLHQNLPLLDLHTWELSNNPSEIKSFRKTLQTVSKSRRKSTQKVYDAKWVVYSNWGHRRKVDSAPITVIVDFLIYLFSEKKYQISTIKGLLNLNLVTESDLIQLSELIRSFELQRPVQRSLAHKWDLSWVLTGLQKAPFEPLHKASKLHFTIKTAFLLALATAKRCSQIHTLAMDANHLRFNQSDGSVSLIVQTDFLAKNQLPCIRPDPIVIPNLARLCKRDQLDRFLCPIIALKFYLKMTSSYRQNRTRLFLLIKSNQAISKALVSRWIAYTIKLACWKLTNRGISFLKIKAHKVTALSSWAFFDKVPLNKILKAAVWRHSSTFIKFYLRDMSQQAENIQRLDPVVVTQKVVGGQQDNAFDA